MFLRIYFTPLPPSSIVPCVDCRSQTTGRLSVQPQVWERESCPSSHEAAASLHHLKPSPPPLIRGYVTHTHAITHQTHVSLPLNAPPSLLVCVFMRTNVCIGVGGPVWIHSRAPLLNHSKGVPGAREKGGDSARWILYLISSSNRIIN